MIGQGGPDIAACSARALWRRAPHPCALLLVLLPLLLAVTPSAAAQETDLRLRMAWGQGTARQWQGSVRLTQGRFLEARCLGLESDSPGSLVQQPSTLFISQRSPRSYDEIEVLVQAPLEAALIIELYADGQRQTVRRFEIPLVDALGSRNEQLDEQGNRLLIHRAPGDSLRLLFRRDALVFAPGEVFQFQVAPHLTRIADRTMRCQLQVRAVQGEQQEVWSQAYDVTLQADGSAPPVGPVQLTMPAAEGVYELLVSLSQRRLTAPFTHRVDLQRSLQFVVIDTQPPAADSAATWEQVDELEPGRSGWQDRLTSLQKWKVLPDFQGEPPGEKSQVVREDNRALVELAPGGWQSYHLPVGELGQPHLLEVEYRATQPQTLGISLIDPNAAGQVTPIGLDSGVDLPAAPLTGDQAFAWHRIVFWPRTKNPMVLLTNRRDNAPAVFGRIRVLAGPKTLPPSSPGQAGGRLLAAYFDKPLFPENFSAREGLDVATGRSLEDWTTFYEGGRRLVEYLKYAGYNGAMVSVLCDGGTIYPSNLLEPTPKYDLGIFFTTGQDARRKDVLEMLFRMFDREGLRLIPAVQFAAPLPELERELRAGTDVIGIQLLDDEGRTWPERYQTQRGLAPYYNPLDPRVQTAMRRVVGELAERYSRHPAFAGVTLQLSPHGYAQLPDQHWGYDPRTVERFARDLQIQWPSAAETNFGQRVAHLRTEASPLWLQWRATELTQFYGRLQQDLLQQRRDARLYLAGAELLASRSIRDALRPTLPERVPVGEALLQMGIAPHLIADYPHLVLLRSQRIAPLEPLSAQAVDVELQTVPEVDRYFAQHAVTAHQYYHEPLPLRLENFDAVSPFGPAKTETYLVAQVAPGASYNRRRFVHSLAVADAEALVDGGWMMPMGQEASLSHVMELYRNLPAQRFRKVEPVGQAGSIQPVTVRTLTLGTRTFVYMVNDSPWPAVVHLGLRAPGNCQLTSLTSRVLPALTLQQDRSRWSVKLPPYEVAGAVFSSAQIKIEHCLVEVEGQVKDQLRDQIVGVQQRILALEKPVPLPVLSNPGFELTSQDQPLPGWVYARGEGIAITSDDGQPRSGERALHMHSDGPVAWVRSMPFTARATGRLSILVWLRIADAAQQPQLRLAVEGKLDGQPYYNVRLVGAGAYAIDTEWSQSYLAQIDDLPLAGLTDLRIGFDLMGAGDVWIDDVQVYDLWFLEAEHVELTKNIAVANSQADNGEVADCLRWLESYWPRFLVRHVPLDMQRVADQRASMTSAPAPQAATPAPPVAENQPPAPAAKRPSTWDRIKELTPKWPF